MIIVLTFTKDQVVQAEKLLDFVFLLQGKKKADAILLVASVDVHDEFRAKIKLAAEVAFEHVNMIRANADMFAAASEYIEAHYKEPWLFLDPDCVPLKPKWIGDLETAYEMQPKKLMGVHLKKDEKMWLAPQAVYSADVQKYTGRDLLAMSSRTNAIQFGKYKGRADLRKDAAMFVSDSTGILIEELRQSLQK